MEGVGGKVKPEPLEDGGENSDEKGPESGGGGGALPEHAGDDDAEKRHDEEEDQHLQFAQDVVEPEATVCRHDGDDDADDRGDAADGEIMLIGRGLANEGLVDVIGPDGGEGADVAGHA